LINPPTEEETIKIIFGLRDKYEAHHRVKISDDAVRAAVYFLATVHPRPLSPR